MKWWKKRGKKPLKVSIFPVDQEDAEGIIKIENVNVVELDGETLHVKNRKDDVHQDHFFNMRELESFHVKDEA